MSATDNRVSCNSPPSNGKKNQDNVIMLNETDTIAVVSPQNITMPINGVILNENASITQPKNVLKNEIISDDPSKHLSIGHDIMLTFLKMVDAKGYENCMGHGNKGKCIKKSMINYTQKMIRSLVSKRQPMILFKRKSPELPKY